MAKAKKKHHQKVKEPSTIDADLGFDLADNSQLAFAYFRMSPRYKSFFKITKYFEGKFHASNHAGTDLIIKDILRVHHYSADAMRGLQEYSSETPISDLPYNFQMCLYAETNSVLYEFGLKELIDPDTPPEKITSAVWHADITCPRITVPSRAVDQGRAYKTWEAFCLIESTHRFLENFSAKVDASKQEKIKNALAYVESAIKNEDTKAMVMKHRALATLVSEFMNKEVYPEWEHIRAPWPERHIVIEIPLSGRPDDIKEQFERLLSQLSITEPRNKPRSDTHKNQIIVYSLAINWASDVGLMAIEEGENQGFFDLISTNNGGISKHGWNKTLRAIIENKGHNIFGNIDELMTRAQRLVMGDYKSLITAGK
jgi:hypothetical protein